MSARASVDASARSRASGSDGVSTFASFTTGETSDISGTSRKASVFRRTMHSVLKQGAVVRGRGKRKRKDPIRFKVFKALREDKRDQTTAKIKQLAGKLRSKPEVDEFQFLKELGYDEEGALAELTDVVLELGMDVAPQVEEMGDPQILGAKRDGSLDPDDPETLQIFKKHKALQGKTLFEAENANNVGVRFYAFGDLTSAKLYFNKALELTSKEKKPAVQETQLLKTFIAKRFGGDETNYFSALTDGDWRLELPRKKFIAVMKKLEYSGDPDRLFTMLDSISHDGKITNTEINALLKTKESKLIELDRELMEKGVALNNLGACHVRAGEPVVALQKFREAMKIVRRVTTLGDHDPLLLRIMTNIAVAYIRSNDHDAALNFLFDILSRREASRGRFHVDSMNALYITGYCFLAKANKFDVMYDCKRMDDEHQEDPVRTNYNIALCAFKELLQRQQQLLKTLEAAGPEGSEPGVLEQQRLEVARMHEVIAEIHDKMGNPTKSVKHMRQAVMYKEDVLGDMDPEMVTSWNVFSAVSLRTKCYQEALVYLDKAKVAAKDLFGSSSAIVANLEYHIGFAYLKMGKEQVSQDKELSRGSFDMAMERLNHVKAVQKAGDGEETLLYAAALHLSGVVSVAQGDKPQGRRLISQALISRVKMLGKNHPITASSAHALGAVYARMPRRRREAIELLRKAVAVREKCLGQMSLYLAESLHELAGALLRRKCQPQDAEEALKHAARAARIRELRLGKQSLEYAASLHNIGRAHTQLGVHSEAKLYLQAALSLRVALAGKRSAQTASSHFALGMALLGLKDLHAAGRHFRKSYTIREAVYGMDHALSADALHQFGVSLVLRSELETALTYLLKALQLRISINEQDVSRLEDDSDIDKKERIRKESHRSKRIEIKRTKRAAEEAEAARQREIEMKRVKDELAREKRRRRSEKRRVSEARRAALGDVRSRFTLFARSSPRSSSTSPRKTSAPTADAQDEDSLDSSDSDEAAKTAAANAALNARGGGETQAAQNEQPAIEGEEQTEPDKDSELDLNDVGVDIRGFLAEEIGDAFQLIATVYLAMQNFEKTRYYLDRAACVREEVHGSSAAPCGETLHTYGLMFKQMGDLAKARRFLRTALAIREAACGITHDQTAETCILLGEVLDDLQQVEDANIFLSGGVHIREILHGRDDAVANQVRNRREKMNADYVLRGYNKPGSAAQATETHEKPPTSEMENLTASIQSLRIAALCHAPPADIPVHLQITSPTAPPATSAATAADDTA